MASKSPTTGKTSGTGAKLVTARVRKKKSPTLAKQGAVKRAAEGSAVPAVTVRRGTASGGFVVYGSPAKPKRASVDQIFRAVLALKAG